MASVKLYPPNIEGTLPAFVKDEKEITSIVVPFTLNKAVSISSIYGFQIKIKTINGTLIGTQTSEDFDEDELKVTFDVSSLVKTDDKEIGLEEGTYYKIQLAFINKDDTVGYYSTVGVAKYTCKPVVTIQNLSDDFDTVNSHIYKYVGVYDQTNGDYTEKMYSYNFSIYKNNELFATSGEIIHDTQKDEDGYIQYDSYSFLDELENDSTYSLVFTVTTFNGLVISSPTYYIANYNGIQCNALIEPTLELDSENGYIKIYINVNQNNTTNGYFYLLRMNKSFPNRWTKICKFTLTNSRGDIEVLQLSKYLSYAYDTEDENRLYWKDFTVEQGRTYVYAFQQYSKESTALSQRIESDPLLVEFEDAFLFDGAKQLKIEYNPKISTFKQDLQEQKVEAIGKKHPYIFRNGRVSYKEFSLSGLLSYLSDDENLFATKSYRMDLRHNTNSPDPRNFDNMPLDEDLLTYGENSLTTYSVYNVASERLFKVKALEWLSDGKAKLFKSPTEGNYIVRVLNTSLSPEDTLGRLVHTFSSTAYEIADCTYENLQYYDIVPYVDSDNGIVTLMDSVDEEKTIRSLNYRTKVFERDLLSINYAEMAAEAEQEKQEQIDLLKKLYLLDDLKVTEDNNEYLSIIEKYNTLKNNYNRYARLNAIKLNEDYTYIKNKTTPVVTSTDVYYFKFSDVLPGTKFMIDGKLFYVSATGTFEFESVEPISEVLLLDAFDENSIIQITGSFTYGYEEEIKNSFDAYKQITNKNIISQISGRMTQDSTPVYDKALKSNSIGEDFNIVENNINNIKNTLDYIYELDATKKFIYVIYKKSNNYYLDSRCNQNYQYQITLYDENNKITNDCSKSCSFIRGNKYFAGSFNLEGIEDDYTERIEMYLIIDLSNNSQYYYMKTDDTADGDEHTRYQIITDQDPELDICWLKINNSNEVYVPQNINLALFNKYFSNGKSLKYYIKNVDNTYSKATEWGDTTQYYVENNQYISLRHINYEHFTDLENIQNISAGPGLLLNLIYRMKVIDYTFEDTDLKTRIAKRWYDLLKETTYIEKNNYKYVSCTDDGTFCDKFSKFGLNENEENYFYYLEDYYDNINNYIKEINDFIDITLSQTNILTIKEYRQIEAEKITDSFSSYSIEDIQNHISDIEKLYINILEKYEEDSAEQYEKLEQKLNNGKITKEQYEIEIKKITTKLQQIKDLLNISNNNEFNDLKLSIQIEILSEAKNALTSSTYTMRNRMKLLEQFYNVYINTVQERYTKLTEEGEI